MAYWSWQEASCLLCNGDPEYSELDTGIRIDPKLANEISRTSKIIYRAFQSGEIKRSENAPLNEYYVEPRKFLLWASSKQFSIPEGFKAIFRDDNSEADIELVLNEKIKTDILQEISEPIKRAKQNGYIELDNLVWVMAIDDSYDEILPDLIKRYHCSKRFPENPTRYDFWTRLLYRWVTGAFDAVSMVGNNRETLPAIKFLPHYRHDCQADAFIRNRPDFFGGKYYDEGVCYIRLGEFKEYLNDYVRIPLPCSIFTIDSSVKESDRSILKYGFAAQRLYNCMATQLRGQKKNITNATDQERRDAAVGVYDDDPKRFSPLSREQVDLPGPYEAAEKQIRKTVGTIIMLANIPGAIGSYQALYKSFKKMEKSIARK